MWVCSGNHTDSKPRSSSARANSSGAIEYAVGNMTTPWSMAPNCTTLCGESAMTSSRHVIVCGAGVVGASVAYFLARRGVRVTVIERTGVACAASGKSGGFLALDWCDGSPLEALARRSFALHASLAEKIDGDWGYRRLATFGGYAGAQRGARRGRTAHVDWVSDGVVV